MTDILRKHELGSVTLGTESGPLGILIPPGLDQFSVNTYCFNSCFEKVNFFNLKFKKFYFNLNCRNLNILHLPWLHHTPNRLEFKYLPK